MAAKVPSTELNIKTNPTPVGVRSEEATAEDFKNIYEVLLDHAQLIDLATGGTSAKKSVGSYTSLTALALAIPVGTLGDYAVIESAPGATLQFAVWNAALPGWQLQAQTEKIAFVPTYANLPIPAQEETIYIVLDTYNMYVYKLGEFHHLNKREGEVLIKDEANRDWWVKKNTFAPNPNYNAIAVGDVCSNFTTSARTRYISFEVLALPVDFDTPASRFIIYEKQKRA